MDIVSAEEMREMDRQTIETFGLPGRLLMETAGRGAAAFFLEVFPQCAGKAVGIVAGRGNNGGDGFVMARCLAEAGAEITVFLLSKKSRLRGDAATNFRLLENMGLPIVEVPDGEALRQQTPLLAVQDIWIDAVLGTGLRSTVSPFFAEVIALINRSEKPVFSVDIPSGLHADTGMPCGACIHAAATATFAFAKIGHLLYPGANHTGRLNIVDIGIPDHIRRRIGPKQHLITQALAARGLVPRRPDAHKGRTGHLLVVAGAPGKTGAAAMATGAALRMGAGCVTAAVAAGIHTVLDSLVIEAMTLPLPDCGGILGPDALPALQKALSGKQCAALGPGLGTASETRKLLHRLLPEIPVPLVLDADALNCLAGHTDLLKTLKVPVVLTPHPGEMARLMDVSVDEIQQDRINAARRAAVSLSCHVVLKGACTVVAHPDGHVYLNRTGNAGMATGGMGDVLTGMVAGLITQGAAPDAAARTAVYLHGAAGDALSTHRGPYGYLATEVMDQLPLQLETLTTAAERHQWTCTRPTP